MKYNLEDLKSHPVFHYFIEISKIPRGSGNEKGISNYLVRFAKERNLDVLQDESLNVIIKKAATNGYDHVPTIIIQGHMDMVCEKNKETIHDFDMDPLQLRVIDDMLYATGTTLGADNGIAVAYALALLDSHDISHPTIEVVITTEEETTMNGAFSIDANHLNGKILINIDSEEDKKLLVSSAGGVHATQTLPITWENAPNNYVAYNIHIKGLKGGHSGLSINKGRGNSIKLLGRLLHDVFNECPIFIQDITGGLKVNAIPREAEVIVLINPDEEQKLFEKIDKWNHIFKNELQFSDPDVSVGLVKSDTPTKKVFSRETTYKTITLLMLTPSGIQGMNMEIEGLVESSSNLGKVTNKNATIYFESEIRSSIKSAKYNIVTQIRLIAELLGGELHTDSDYPEWPYHASSKIKGIFEDTFKEKYNSEIEIMAVHAGIECGIFIEKIPGLDAISIGPDIFQVHTPNEHLSIPSTINNWEYFLYTLEKIKNYY